MENQLDLSMFFVITKDNWQETKNQFVGYKTLGNNGLWTEVTNFGDRVEIHGSFINPCIAIYNKDNYWAVSNSVLLLKEHLAKKGISIELNSKVVSDLSSALDPYNCTYSDTKTIFKDINLNSMFSYLLINSLGVNEIKFDPHLFEYSFLENPKLVDDWFCSWQDFFHMTKAKMNMQLSGGFDSRLIFGMIRDIERVKYKTRWNKTGHEDTWDGDIAKEIFEFYGIDSSRYSIKSKEKTKIRNQTVATSTLADYFMYGVTAKYNKDPNFIRHDKETLMITGIGTEVYKIDAFKTTKFLAEIVRHNWCQSHLFKYYLSGVKAVFPYLDEKLLVINPHAPQLLQVYAYLKYFPEAFTNGIKFISYDEPFDPRTDSNIQICKRFLEQHNLV